MAKKKPPKKRPSKKPVKQKLEAITGEPIAADAIMASTVTDMERKLAKEDRLVGKESIARVIPMPAICLRYLLQSEGWPLSSCYQFVGPPGSYKSTMLAEVQRWHRICGGLNVTMEAETKDQEDLRRAILGYSPAACKVEECNYLEEWQDKVTWYTHMLQDKMDGDEAMGRTIPVCLGVDSLTGKAAEKTAEKIKASGHATLSFPIEANMIKTYMQVMPSWLLGWPFTFVGINHLKVHKDPLTGIIDENIAGGWALKFQCLCIFIMEKLGRVQQKANYNEAKVQIETYKNNMGPDRLRLLTPLRTWNATDPQTGESQLHGRFEWWEASVLLLHKGVGMRTALTKMLLPRIKEVCDFHDKSGGSQGTLYWSNRLGVPSSEAMPAHDLGVILEQNAEVLGELYPVLGIKRRQFFEPGVDYMQQLDDAARRADEEQQANDEAQRTQALVKDSAGSTDG